MPAARGWGRWLSCLAAAAIGFGLADAALRAPPPESTRLRPADEARARGDVATPQREEASSAAQPTAEHRVASPPASRAAPAAHAPNAPFAAEFGSLVEAMRAGDRAAADRVAQGLQDCFELRAEPVRHQALQAAVGGDARALARLQDFGLLPMSRAEVESWLKASRFADWQRECGGLPAGWEQGAIALAREAALAGGASAAARYAFDPPFDRMGQVRQIDEIERFRRDAVAMAERAVAGGEAFALYDYARLHGGDDERSAALGALVPRDRVRSLAEFEVYFRCVGPVAQYDPRSSLRQGMSAEDQARAERMAEQLFQASYAQAPECRRR
jgi:hypothetical protein